MLAARLFGLRTVGWSRRAHLAREKVGRLVWGRCVRACMRAWVGGRAGGAGGRVRGWVGGWVGGWVSVCVCGWVLFQFCVAQNTFCCFLARTCVVWFLNGCRLFEGSQLLVGVCPLFARFKNSVYFLAFVVSRSFPCRPTSKSMDPPCKGGSGRSPVKTLQTSLKRKRTWKVTDCTEALVGYRGFIGPNVVRNSTRSSSREIRIRPLFCSLF